MIYAISLCHCFTFYFIIEIFNCSFERCMAHFSSARSSKFEVFDNLPHSCKIVAFLISFKAKCGQKNATIERYTFHKKDPLHKSSLYMFCFNIESTYLLALAFIIIFNQYWLYTIGETSINVTMVQKFERSIAIQNYINM